MDYGDILTDTFRIIWREKKLWVISALGVMLPSVVYAMYTGAAMGWQTNWLSNPAVMGGGMTNEAFFQGFTRFLLGYLALLGFMAVFGLAGYVINLIARAAVVAEAIRAIRGGKTDIRRGLGRGAHKAAAYFVLDLLWALPWILAGLLGAFLALITAGGVFSALVSQEFADEGGVILGMVGVIFAMLGLFACLALLIAFFKGVFAPLMYQASVIDDLPLGDAIREGWRLSREHIGPMIVFLLLNWAVLFGLSLIARIFITPFSFMLMSPWFSMMRAFEDGPMSAGPSAGNWLLMTIGVIGMGAVTWLLWSLSQTFRLVYYANVYEALRGRRQQARSETEPPASFRGSEAAGESSEAPFGLDPSSLRSSE